MLQVYWQDSLRGFGIPAVISSSRIVPAASSCRLEPTGPGLRPGPGLSMWAGTTRPKARAYTTITLRGHRPNSPTGPAVRCAFLRVSGVTGQDPGPGLAPGRRPCRARHRPPAADLNSPRPVRPDLQVAVLNSCTARNMSFSEHSRDSPVLEQRAFGQSCPPGELRSSCHHRSKVPPSASRTKICAGTL